MAGALGVAGTVGAVAVAAAGVSPFAGSYSGSVPWGHDGELSAWQQISVTEAGRVSGSGSGSWFANYDAYGSWTGEMSGTVSDTGKLSVHVVRNTVNNATGKKSRSGLRIVTTMTRNIDGTVSATWTDVDGYPVAFSWSPD